MPQLNNALNRFGLALTFLTRAPWPGTLNFSQSELNRANGWFPAIGFVLGLWLAFNAWWLNQWFSSDITAGLIILLSLLSTGAFHEDGLTDSADGLGGGMTVERKLSIMKDSRIGTYGAAALVLSLLLRWLCLRELPDLAGGWWLLAPIHAASRLIPVLLLGGLKHVSVDDGIKTKPLAQTLLPQDAVLAIITVIVALLTFCTWSQSLLIVSAGTLVTIGWRHYLQCQIQGFTGDTLGASQQLSELAMLLFVLARLSH